MIPEAHSSKLVWGPIRDVVGALEDLACSGTGRGNPYPPRWWIVVEIILLSFGTG